MPPLRERSSSEGHRCRSVAEPRQRDGIRAPRDGCPDRVSCRGEDARDVGSAGPARDPTVRRDEDSIASSIAGVCMDRVPAWRCRVRSRTPLAGRSGRTWASSRVRCRTLDRHRGCGRPSTHVRSRACSSCTASAGAPWLASRPRASRRCGASGRAPGVTPRAAAVARRQLRPNVPAPCLRSRRSRETAARWPRSASPRRSRGPAGEARPSARP
jgi:hypothetical protein